MSDQSEIKRTFHVHTDSLRAITEALEQFGEFNREQEGVECFVLLAVGRKDCKVLFKTVGDLNSCLDLLLDALHHLCESIEQFEKLNSVKKLND